MILKILLVLGVIGVVYFFFIKKKPEKVNTSTKKKEESDSSEMVECATCNTYISLDEAIVSSSKYYCSQECIKA